MKTIKITSDINYQVKLSEGIYYPTIPDIVDFDGNGKPLLKKDGYAEMSFYIPYGDKLLLRDCGLDTSHLKHLKFPNLEKEVPKIFVHETLAEILGVCEFKTIPPYLIKNASEIEDYQKYFEMFKWGVKKSKIFKDEKGNSLYEFNKEPPCFFPKDSN